MTFATNLKQHVTHLNKLKLTLKQQRNFEIFKLGKANSWKAHKNQLCVANQRSIKDQKNQWGLEKNMYIDTCFVDIDIRGVIEKLK